MNELRDDVSGGVRERLAALGLELPIVPTPAGAYLPVRRAGPFVITSSISAKDGARTRYLGRLGENLTIAEGRESARLAVLNTLAAVASVIDLDEVAAVVSVTGYVSSTPGFDKQHRVVDGASELLHDIFGDAGRHTRAAIGVASLPLGCSVGIALTVVTAGA